MKPKTESDAWTDVTLEVTPEFVAVAEKLRARCETLNLNFDELMSDVFEMAINRIEGQLVLRGIKGESHR
jgi:hypothetical protein